MTRETIATAADGTEVRAYDEGQGPVILLVHPGLDDGTRTEKLAALLSDRYRVLRLQRRQYRFAEPCTMADEVQDVLALAAEAGGPVLVYGHSSGAVVTLEALVARPEAFAGAVLYEPPTVVDRPFPPESVAKAKAAIARGRPGRAIRIFVRDVVGLPAWQGLLVGLAVGLSPRFRRLAPRQLHDLDAIIALGVRLDEYAKITVRTVLLGGDKSPTHLLDRLDALRNVIDQAERVQLPGRDHGADVAAPAEVAQVIATLADRVFTSA
ncbi:alpha/beta fold hydrolase [Actinocrispum wychmicini]|uniref:Pimeloyl-ACP methyl ester carboxylesterase n=1 Tax=Actinocrispum wychmicini TaxID=1213861 RepID=A0A4R2IPE6_9PSEU|nr:alpha/beta hydrolase [Actinocrispum wychmicini]TCO46462.1 pimeloyl-ACP methyl ester carboxylesterase [Actinocrispum wychmicini]